MTKKAKFPNTIYVKREDDGAEGTFLPYLGTAWETLDATAEIGETIAVGVYGLLRKAMVTAEVLIKEIK